MNIQYLSIYKVHEYLMDFPPSTDNFDLRKIAQKVIYLADSLGVYCGDFTWNWYKNGPYSPSLTRVLYDNGESSSIDFEKYEVEKGALEVLKPLKKTINSKPSDLSEADWMELIASIHYIYYKQSLKKDKQDIATKLVDKKPQYTLEQALFAYTVLENNNLFR